jgi:hypothetical protein
MDSTQKILKELSDLTRNLDVLAKEIREMNKISSKNQKTAAKTIETMENSVKKTEEVSAQVEKSTKQENNKKEGSKTTSSSGKSPNGIFSNFINSIKDTFKNESPQPKKASLATLNQSPTVKKDLSLLNPSDPEYAETLNKLNNGGDPRGMATAAIKKQLETLRNKEKKTKEEEEQIKKAETYIKEKEGKETSKTSQPVPAKPEVTGKKDENKGFFEKLIEKMSPGKGGKEVLSTVGSFSKPETKTESNRGKESKKDENKGFFARLAEKIRPEKKEDKEAPKTPENKPEEKKSSAEAITQAPKLTEGQKIKEDLKNLYGQSRLGKTVSGIKSLFKKKEEPKAEGTGKSEIKKEEQTLKSAPSKESKPATPPAETKKSEEIKPTPAASTSSPTSTTTTPASSVTSTSSETKKSDTESSVPLTSEDIKEIKSLLSSINSALKGPLMLKDNKPFRPMSNMLE